MYIHEAINARTENQPHITRGKWLDKLGEWVSPRIIPTNSPDGMVYESRAQKEPRRGWQPTAEDLTAKDWITIN